MGYVIILLLVGILLAFLETFVPSGGILAFLATVSLASAIILGFMHGGPTGWIILFTSLVCVPILVVFGLKIIPRTRFGRKLLLIETNEAFAEARGKAGISDENFGPLKGKTGIAVTQLRPSGIAEIEGKRYSVIAEGKVINQQCDIVVTRIEGNSIIVESKQENVQG